MVRGACWRLVVAAVGAAAAGCYLSHEREHPDANPPDTFGNRCATDGDCDDGEPCNGAEWCDMPPGRCMAGTQLADFTQCRTPDGRYASCVDGACDLRWEEICIPTGPFVMGVDMEDYEGAGLFGTWSPAWPKHIVTLSAYCIDKYEVTNRRVRRCTDAGRCRPAVADVLCSEPGGPYTYSDAHLDYPATYMGILGRSFVDLDEICAFEGKRPPTEAEWEKAAKGGCETAGNPDACDTADERKYPWGDARPTRELVANQGGDYMPVGSRPAGASPYGVMDMAGSVKEFTIDCDGQPRGWSVEDGTLGYVACAEGCVDPWAVCETRDGYGPSAIERGGASGCSGMWEGELTVYSRFASPGGTGTGETGGRCVRSTAVLQPVEMEEEP